MNIEDVKAKLCWYDPENPNYDKDSYEDGDRPEPRKDCHCDNCFYGRDRLARHILSISDSNKDLLVVLKEAAELLETARQYFPKSIRNADKFHLLNVCASINKAIAKAEGSNP